jgi:hypothetical protein
MNEKIWVRSKWKKEDLLGHSVEFKLPIEGGEVHGVGQLIVASNPEGYLSINIRTNLHGDVPNEKGVHDFHLNQWAADRLERHSDKNKANFTCLS